MDATLTFDLDESEVDGFVERLSKRWPDLKIVVRSTVMPQKAPDSYSSEFEEFWESFPKKVNKPLAYRNWNARISEGREATQLITASKIYARSISREGKESKFTLHPSTFLGPGERWLEWIREEKEPSYRP